MNLWMVKLAIWKPLESTKDGKKMNILRIVDQNHERPVVVLYHFTNFKSIWLIVELQHQKWGGNTYPGKRKLASYCSNLKKEWTLKTKKLLQLLGILDEQEPSVQPIEKVWSWGNIYLAKHQKWLLYSIYLWK